MMLDRHYRLFEEAHPYRVRKVWAVSAWDAMRRTGIGACRVGVREGGEWHDLGRCTPRPTAMPGGRMRSDPKSA